MTPELLADWRWRLSNLYKIRKEGEGDPIPFKMRQEQEMVITSLRESPTVPVYIIKARRLGLSTGIGVAMADEAIWKGGTQARLIERSKEFAAEKMRNIIRFAAESMPDELTSRLEVFKRSDSDFELKIKTVPDEFKSSIHAGVQARGGDCSFLWVSEWGPIAFEDRPRSAEIRSGALPAARKGKRVVETTWMGGKSGDLWELIEPIMKKAEDAEGVLMFFPWHNDPECARFDGGTVSGEVEQYFRDLAEKTKKGFTQAQKRWYTLTSAQQGSKMKREFPSTIDECWEAPIIGAIYGVMMDTLMTRGQITSLPHNPEYTVDTFWDLGAPENTVVWYTQTIAGYEHVIDCDHNLFLTTEQRTAHMRAKGYDFNAHYVPHDANALRPGGMTFREELTLAGLENVVTVPRTTDPWLGINEVSKMLDLCMFDADKCKRGLEALREYRRKQDEKTGLLTNDIVHNWCSHFCDSLRVKAEAKMSGVMVTKSSRRFDASGVERLRIASVPTTAQPRIMEIITNETTRASVPRDNPGGWCRVWNTPMEGRSYVLSVRFRDGKLLVGSATRRDTNAIGVLCSEHVDPETRAVTPAKLVAALQLEDESAPDVVMQRVLALHRMYGRCTVVPIIDNLDNAANRLMEIGVQNLWGPGMGADGSRLTQGKSTETFGWLSKPGLHRQSTDNLDRVIREQKLVVNCPEMIRQLSYITVNKDGDPVPPAGERDDWLRMLSVGMSCIQFATQFTPHLEGPPDAQYSYRDDGFDWDNQAHGL